jgi:uncharacterized glyoxalase superfamily protein PhnB
MSSLAKNTKATVIPCLRYRNAPAAIEWLCQTFGLRSISSCGARAKPSSMPSSASATE